MKDGYPTDDELEIIKEWSVETREDLEGFVDYLKQFFKIYGRCEINGDELEIATGGWSGCEDVISALIKNRLFWLRFWESSHRGGLYTFKVPGENK